VFTFFFFIFVAVCCIVIRLFDYLLYLLVVYVCCCLFCSVLFYLYFISQMQKQFPMVRSRLTGCESRIGVFVVPVVVIVVVRICVQCHLFCCV
jgi:hypothetical protein